MVLYTCERCKKEFFKKSNYEAHCNRKYKCKIKEEIYKKDDKLSNTQIILEQLINKIEELAKDNKFLKDQITELTTNKFMKNNNNNNINSNNNQNYYVMINKFGNETDNHLTESEGLKIMNKGYNSIPEYIKAVHFNEAKPENHNLYLPNWRDKNKILTFDGKNWILNDKDDILDDLKNKGIDFIQKRYQDLDKDNKTDAIAIKKIDRFLNSYNNDEKDKELILNEKILLVLYNGRKIIEKKKTK